MRAGRTVAVAAGGLLLMGGLAACGGDDGGGGQDTEQESQESADQQGDQGDDTAEEPADTAPRGEGMDGTWAPINDSPIETLTVTGEDAETTGALACPGTLTSEGGETRIELACGTPDEQRSAGTVELDPDGTHLVISWDGPEWGGMIDSFTPAG
ncbi:hypothetical protein [Streptomyces johnsoniae]|uniref:Lipoprotein n=1 Tax=Streptomyces johnsoniae TaxID=3075532 RepID=A0ABU2SBB2_9ACTN|nr:hypothetical protein [Streptomyces sp. DSM 41886]MDT0446218.1 hypothetical protein [Streptomyces sp. DSM 41886]